MSDVNSKTVALLCFENERPLQGLMGKLDWKFNGVFTKLVRNGTLTGQKNEMGYVPLKWNQDTYHFLILGSGENKIPGKRSPLSPAQIQLFNQKASDLGLSGIMIEGESESDEI